MSEGKGFTRSQIKNEFAPKVAEAIRRADYDAFKEILSAAEIFPGSERFRSLEAEFGGRLRSVEGVSTDCLNYTALLFLRQGLYVLRDRVQHLVQNLFGFCLSGCSHAALHHLLQISNFWPSIHQLVLPF
jgi:hypothetical protein